MADEFKINRAIEYPIELRGYVQDGALVISVSGHPVIRRLRAGASRCCRSI